MTDDILKQFEEFKRQGLSNSEAIRRIREILINLSKSDIGQKKSRLQGKITKLIDDLEAIVPKK